jgi:Bacterial SH3 domain
MKYLAIFFALALLAPGQTSPLGGQLGEVKLDTAQTKITTVSAMRVRKAPQITSEEVVRLKLGTVVDAVARSANQDTIGGKTDYWYRVNLPNNETGWLFGGLLLDVVEQRTDLKKTLASLRLALAKTTAPERSELLKKLERIKS